jgi:hypothetical protein
MRGAASSGPRRPEPISVLSLLDASDEPRDLVLDRLGDGARP